MNAPGPPSGLVTMASPALVWAVATWMGCLAGWALVGPGPGLAWHAAVLPGTVVMACLVGLAALAVARPRSPSTWSPLVTLVGAVLAAGAGGVLAVHAAVVLDQGPVVALAREGGGGEFVGTVSSEPVQRPDGTSWMLVTITRMDHEGRSWDGRWRVLVAGQQEPPAVGARVRLSATARPLDSDGFDAFLRRRHVGVALDVSHLEVVTPPTGLLEHVERVRATIRRAAADGLDGDAAGLAVGLVTGDTRLLSEDAQDDMRATGLTHLVAVSGSNVALVAGVVAALAGAAPARVRRWLVGAAIVAFVVTTRAEPSVLRAGVMAGMVMVARTRGRPSVGMHALAVAVVVLLLADAASAGALGLVLSVVATVGVLVVAPIIVARLPTRLPRPVGLLVAASVGAQVTVAPVLLATVGDVPLAALPANVVAVPAAGIASLVAVVGAVVAQLDSGSGATIMSLAGAPLDVVLAVARHGGRGPVLSLAAPGGVALATSLVVAVLSGARTRWRRGAAIAATLCIMAMAWSGRSTSWHSPEVLSITAIDVGQGDAILVTTASGHRMLVDAGRDDSAARWLARHHVDRLDLVVVTHADADHAGGLDEVLATVVVPTVWVSGGPDGAPSSAWPADWRTDATTQLPAPPPGTVAVNAGVVARLGSARIEVLGPPSGHDLVATEGGRNDRSVVVRVSEGERVAMFPGDAEAAAQQWLLATGVDLDVDVAMVPHHGADTSDPDFLSALDPEVAVISVGVDNDYGHPTSTVLDLLADGGARVRRTDLEGTVTVVVPTG